MRGCAFLGPDTVENIQHREDLDPRCNTGSSTLCGLSEVTILSDCPGFENEDDNPTLETHIGEEKGYFPPSGGILTNPESSPPSPPSPPLLSRCWEFSLKT